MFFIVKAAWGVPRTWPWSGETDAEGREEEERERREGKRRPEVVCGGFPWPPWAASGAPRGAPGVPEGASGWSEGCGRASQGGNGMVEKPLVSIVKVAWGAPRPWPWSGETDAEGGGEEESERMGGKKRPEVSVRPRES